MEKEKQTTETITLMDGRTLTCALRPALQQDPPADNSFRLDTTGQYLTIRHPRKTPTPDQQRHELTLERKVFTDHAWLFWDNIDRIFSDSRMFFAPVPVSHSLAYTGASGFGAATLGTYLEWWLYGPSTLHFDDDGRRALTFQIAGSPLSGRNGCSCVHEDGTVTTVHHGEFSSVWGTLHQLCGRYQPTASRCECYTLQQVIDNLTQSPSDECTLLRGELMHRDAVIRHLRLAINKKNTQLTQLSDALDQAQMDLHRPALQTFTDDCRARRQRMEDAVAALNAERAALRARLRSGELDNRSYERLVIPINRQKNDVRQHFDEWCQDQKQTLCQKGIRPSLIDSLIETSCENEN